MIRSDRQRPRRTPNVEGLESRNLLSAGIAPSNLAEVHALKTGTPPIKIPLIKGTLHGMVTSVTPTSSTSEVVTYTVVGKANIIGDGHGNGQHTITSKLVKRHSTNDTYAHGQAKLIGTTDTVAITYSGSGHTNANGSFTATLKGKATSVAGLHAGRSGPFNASLSGNNSSSSFTVSFTIKL